MKYKIGDYILLHDGRTVYVYQVDPYSRTYYVCGDNQDDDFTVNDDEIYGLVTPS